MQSQPDGYSLEVISGDLPGSCSSLVDDDAASFFARDAWRRAVREAEPSFDSRWLLAIGPGGEARGACLLFGKSQWGMSRFYGGALGTYAAFLVRDAAAGRRLATAVADHAAARRTLLMRFHDFSGACHEYFPDEWCRSREVCQVLELPDNSERLFRERLTPKNRNKIRKAVKLGVEVECRNDTDAMQRYLALYDESVRRWGAKSAIPRRLFEALVGVQGVEIWLATHVGRTIAGLLNLTSGGQIMNWGNVSRREAWKMAPNNLLHWRAIERACQDVHAPRLYNFGSSAGLPGVETFKSAFGATQHVYQRIEYRSALLSWKFR